MRNRSQNVINAGIFLVVILGIVLLLKTPPGRWVQGGFEQVFAGVGKVFFGVSQNAKKPFEDTESVRLQKENTSLREQLVTLELLKKDNVALSDQFQTASIKSSILLPVHIVSMPQFIPGISTPDSFIIDMGKNGQIREGMGVVFGENLIGKVTKVSENVSEVLVISSSKMTLSGKTSRTAALGVVRGRSEGELFFDAVLPSEDVKSGDMIVSVGDMNLQGVGIPGNMIIGKIVSVDKKPSAMFQTAKIKSLIDVSRLSTVFVIVAPSL